MAFELRVTSLTHHYGPVRALDAVSLTVGAGEMLAIVGESGSGKTTLLRAFNRTIEPAAGAVCINGRDVTHEDPVALRRQIGYVPQSGGLLPHWTIARNVALVPRLLKRDGPSSPALAADAALALCGLPPAEFGGRYPRELSGGQRQRAALARALAARQELVLLDESFSALDAISRTEVLEAFAAIRESVAFTAVLVTHDLGEAARLATKIAVMRTGRIEQIGTLHELTERPSTPYVAALIGRAIANARLLVDA